MECSRCGNPDSKLNPVTFIQARGSTQWCKRCDLFVSVLEANFEGIAAQRVQAEQAE